MSPEKNSGFEDDPFQPKKMPPPPFYGTFVGFRGVNYNLVVGFNPFQKYARQIGSFPQGSG